MWFTKKSIKVRGNNNVMFTFMKKLPEDVVLIISSYYGSKISRELSNEINDQRFLYAIKEKEYFDTKLRIWRTMSVGNIFKDQASVPAKLREEYDLALWKDVDKLITKMWRALSSDERKKIIEKHFPDIFAYDAEFITFREFFYFHFGYHIS
jgi:hypothetical protein